MAVNQSSLRRRLRLVIWVLTLVIYHDVHSCSLPKGWSTLSISKRAALADIVMVGEVMQTFNRRSQQEETKPKQGYYDALFRVLCTLKGAQLQAFVNVSGFGFVSGHCVNSHALSNRTYIAFLRKRRGRYFVAEVNMQHGTVPFKLHLERKLVKKLRSKHCRRDLLRGREEPVREVKQVFDRKKMTRVPKTAAPVTERALVRQNIDGISNTALRERPGGALVLLLIYCLYYVST